MSVGWVGRRRDGRVGRIFGYFFWFRYLARYWVRLGIGSIVGLLRKISLVVRGLLVGLFGLIGF